MNRFTMMSDEQLDDAISRLESMLSDQLPNSIKEGYAQALDLARAEKQKRH